MNNTHEENFKLDERLAKDTIKLAELNVCDVLLMNDANYPWFIFVPRVPNVSEFFDLSNELQVKVLFEIDCFAKTLKQVLQADKVNIAALGNQVEQLHLHVILRYKNDIAWPNPVWGVHPAKKYNLQQIIDLQKVFSEILPIYKDKSAAED